MSLLAEAVADRGAEGIRPLCRHGLRDRDLRRLELETLAEGSGER